MVSRKNQGFQVSKNRQNRVRLNVSKWMIMGALNGRSETGSETEAGREWDKRTTAELSAF